MIGKLESGRKLIMDLIEQSIGAFEQREELCNKLQNLETKSDNEQNVHLQEMRELQRKLDHDIKLKEFFAVKSNHRVNAELEAREALHKQQQQELADKQLNDLQDVMAQIQVKHIAHNLLTTTLQLKSHGRFLLCFLLLLLMVVNFDAVL